MPRSLPPRLDFLRRAAGLDHRTLARWRRLGILFPDLSDVDPAVTRFDVMTAAVLAELACHSIGEPALQAISAYIHEGAQVIARHNLDGTSIPRILYHGALRLADEDGRFAEFVMTNGMDPEARLFARYADYLAWCRQRGTAPKPQEEELLSRLEPDDLAYLPYCYDLINDLPPSHCSVLWDVMIMDETPLLYSRRSFDPPPRNIWSGDEATSWLTISITAIDREVGRRVARAA